MAALIRRWLWLFGAVVLATTATTLYVLRDEGGDHESTTTFVVRPAAGDENDLIRAAANLSGSAKVNNTISQIIESELVRERAIAERSAAVDGSADFDVGASVAPGSNILTVRVRSEDPLVAFEMARAVGAAAIGYLSEFEDLYELAVLDEPEPPRPVGTSWLGPSRVGVAAVLGGLLGLVSVAAANRCFPRGWRGGRAVVETCSTRLDDEKYLRLRLQEEVARSDSSGVPFHLVVLQVWVRSRGRKHRSTVVPPHRADIPRLARSIYPTLREYDHLGHLSTLAVGTFAVILPGRSDHEVEGLTICWEETAGDSVRRAFRNGVAVSADTCRYEKSELTPRGTATEIVGLL